MKHLSAQQIRDEFLRFFQDRGHLWVRSSSLIPSDDPTVLLTTAGMQQFKPYFLGEQAPPGRRLTSVQKCFRTSDIDAVGDATHDTFFEMLGNFSVGDYFKKEAISFAWELLTRAWGIPEERLSVTIFGGERVIPEDQEAADLWQARGVPAAKIFRFGTTDNFWGPPGPTGPCGPCSEIHFDLTRNPCSLGASCRPNCACGRFLEIWNLVFMQYNKRGEDVFEPLPAKNIDTGMGLERIALVLQEKPSIFETDLFRPLLESISEICGLRLETMDAAALRSCRIIADHLRGAAFLVSDGVLPSNEGRGYVLRRILRRSLVHARRLGHAGPLVDRVLEVILAMFRQSYPELADNRAFVSRVLGSEEKRFLETLETGIRIFQTELDKLEAAGGGTLPGHLVFKLYDTYGFPPELTQDLAAERKLAVDLDGFAACMEEQKEKARASWKGTDAGRWSQEGALAGVQSEFVGYDRLENTSVIALLVTGGKRTPEVREGDEAELVVQQTPFYAESGGQVGDQGVIEGARGSFLVTNTYYGPGHTILHTGKVTRGRLQEGEEVLLRVDGRRRRATAGNHTATHLLQFALRTLLGDHVRQSGSLVSPDRLRFDFTHFAPLSEEETRSVEALVNERIRENHSMEVRHLSFQEAQAQKAIALFGEKYGDVVRLANIGGFSKELCGGTHVTRTGDIGFFKIVHESSVAAGVRRIEALTGEGATRYVQDLEKEYRQVSSALQARPGEVLQRIQRLQDKHKELEKGLQSKHKDQLLEKAEEILASAEKIGAIPVVTAQYEADAATLRKLADFIKDRLRSGVVLLASGDQGKVQLILSVTKDLIPPLHAGNLIREVAKEVGGSGGGKPEMAQAGGSRPEAVPGAFERLKALLAAASGKAKSTS
ncbi:MAG: alanine--tRNA ligase [bacterium]